MEINPDSKPPIVPGEGTYVDALNEAGVDQERIDQLQQSKYFYFKFNIDPTHIDINAEEFNIFNQYSKEEIDNFKCIFDMFDKEKTNFVSVNDLQTIMKSLGRDP